MSEDRELTFGERAVRLTFNPSGDHKVTVLKQAFARIIDMLDAERGQPCTGHDFSSIAVAITEAQTALLWAVKAVTREG